jgi:hypothetical protein
MKAIITKYIGPTNSHGSRFKATAEGGRGTPLTITVPYNYALNSFKKELRSERGNMSGKEFKKFVLKEWSKLAREMKLTYCNPNIYDLGADVPSPQPKV